VDSADFYGRGESEQILGKALKGRRDDVVLATKAHNPMGDDPNMRGNSRRWLTARAGRLAAPAADRSRRPVPDAPARCRHLRRGNTRDTHRLIQAGKVGAIGGSSYLASAIVEAQWVAERRGLARRW